MGLTGGGGVVELRAQVCAGVLASADEGVEAVFVDSGDVLHDGYRSGGILGAKVAAGA